MRFIKTVAVLSFAFAMLAGGQPALAKSQCKQEGSWRRGESGVAKGVHDQVFRIEARNRSDIEGVVAKVAGDDTEYKLGRGFERLVRNEHTRKQLKHEETQSLSENVGFYTSDGKHFASCTFLYKVRFSRDEAGTYSEYAEIKYAGGGCYPKNGHKVSCEREYAPKQNRMKVSITIKK